MKILFFTSELYAGGAETVLRNVCSGLSNRGHEIVIVTNDDSQKNIVSDDLYIEFKRFDYGIRIIKPMFIPGNGVRFVNYLSALYFTRKHIHSIINTINPDVIVSFLYHINCKILSYTVNLNIPIIVCEHTAVNRSIPNKFKWYRRVSYPFADAVTVLTHSDLKIWNKHKNVVLLSNPIKVLNVSCSDEREKIILAAGRLSDWKVKGFDTLINVWSSLHAKNPEWKLQIAGWGSEDAFEYLKSFAKEKGCEKIEFLGQLTDLQDYMKKCEIFVMTSRFEGLPVVLCEAMNANCCCVAFDCDNGPREIIENGKTGILVQNQNEDAMVETLQRLMNSPEERLRLAFNSRESIKKFDEEVILDRWEDLLNTVINKGSLEKFRQ